MWTPRNLHLFAMFDLKKKLDKGKLNNRETKFCLTKKFTWNLKKETLVHSAITSKVWVVNKTIHEGISLSNSYKRPSIFFPLLPPAQNFKQKLKASVSMTDDSREKIGVAVK